MSDKYNFKEEEPKWVAFWEKEGVFTFDPKANGEVYSIDTPPPTVSGKMHIGHAFSYTQQDILARYKRLRGFNVFYPWGTDDNGLPTERLVEKMKGVKGSKMDRQDFIKLCEQTLKEILPDFVGDWKRIGVSCDFTKSYSTIDANCRRISQWSFLDLQKKGRAYRKEAPAIWCPLCETAIAQVECQDKEKQTQFVHVEVKTGSGDHVTFATTRPELMMACIAISVHPDDARYKHLVGKTATIPVSGAVVPIIADSLTKMEFGSGVVYWCPYGDAVDVEFVAKHPELKVQHIMNKNGTLNEKAGKYAGLAVIQARKQVIADWQAAGAIKKLEPRSNVVNVHERCGTEIEFYVSPQWFIKYLDLKDKLLDWGAELHWHPDFMKHRYDNWVRGLKWDWCISRQRFFGVPFPVWYCVNCNNVSVADEKDLPVYPFDSKPKKKCKCGSSKFEGEQDVMDTWATSSVTPQIILNWVKDKEYNTNIKMYPCSLRPQAHDIIRTWAFYTIVKGIYHNNKHPWKDIVISGHVLDPNGQSMHKSKGNVIEPSKVLEKYSADALRFWAASSKLGDDLRYLEKELETGQKTLTKLWNSFKFVKLSLENYKHKKLKKLEPIDELFLLELNSIVKEYRKNFEIYEYSKSKYAIDNFFWHSFCDYYLEFVKKRIYNNTNGKESAQYTLYTSLFSIIKMFAPIMPFVTEEIYQDFFRKHEKEKSIHLILIQRYNPKMKDTKELWQLLIGTISKIRQEKARLNKSLKEEVKTITCDLKLKDFENDIKGVMNVKEIKYGKEFSIHV